MISPDDNDDMTVAIMMMILIIVVVIIAHLNSRSQDPQPVRVVEAPHVVVSFSEKELVEDNAVQRGFEFRVFQTICHSVCPAILPGEGWGEIESISPPPTKHIS